MNNQYVAIDNIISFQLSTDHDFYAVYRSVESEYDAFAVPVIGTAIVEDSRQMSTPYYCTHDPGEGIYPVEPGIGNCIGVFRLCDLQKNMFKSPYLKDIGTIQVIKGPVAGDVINV